MASPSMVSWTTCVLSTINLAPMLKREFTASTIGPSPGPWSWRGGDATAGVVAADAMDQLSGLLDDSEFVQVRDDSGQNATHSGSIKPNVFHLGIGLGSEIHNDLFAALQTLLR